MEEKEQKPAGYSASNIQVLEGLEGADKTALLGNFSFNFTALVQGILLLTLAVKEFDFGFAAAFQFLKSAYKKNVHIRRGDSV